MTAKTFLTLVLFATLLTSGSPTADAAVMSRDWKTPGDGLLTYDDVNQREWLDIPETLLSKFGSFENVVSQTGPGGLFDGFTAARSADVLALSESAGINVSSSILSENEVATRNLIELLGETVQLSGGRVSTTGMLNEFSIAHPTSRLVANIRVTPQINTATFELIPFSAISVDSPPSITGAMLFHSVPEPSTCVIMLTCMILLGLLNCFRSRYFTLKR